MTAYKKTCRIADMPTEDIEIELQITCASWCKVPRLRSHIQKAAQAAYEHIPKKLQKPVIVSVLLAGNAKIRQLNKAFRGMDKPTNVLSFPQFAPQELTAAFKGDSPLELGDMVLAYQYVVSEAKSDNKILVNHLSHLIIHGILHLFGYDHLCDQEADRMEKLETRIMKSMGLPDPYFVDEQAKTFKKK